MPLSPKSSVERRDTRSVSPRQSHEGSSSRTSPPCERRASSTRTVKARMASSSKPMSSQAAMYVFSRSTRGRAGIKAHRRAAALPHADARYSVRRPPRGGSGGRQEYPVNVPSWAACRIRRCGRSRCRRRSAGIESKTYRTWKYLLDLVRIVFPVPQALMQKAGAVPKGPRLPRYGKSEAQPAHCCTKARAASPAVAQMPAPRSPQTCWKALRTVSVMRPSLVKESSAASVCRIPA